MSSITIFILGIILFIIFVYNFMKRSIIKKLAAALKEKRYDEVIQIAQANMTRSLAGRYICDLHLLRALYFKEDTEVFLNTLKAVLQETGDKAERKDYLETYFHLFLKKKNKEIVDQLLILIQEHGSYNFNMVTQFAYDITFTNTSSNVAELEKELDNLRFFDLGVAALYLAKYYENQKGFDQAYALYESVAGILPVTHYYAVEAKEALERFEVIEE